MPADTPTAASQAIAMVTAHRAGEHTEAGRILADVVVAGQLTGVVATLLGLLDIVATTAEEFATVSVEYIAAMRAQLAMRGNPLTPFVFEDLLSQAAVNAAAQDFPGPEVR